MPSMEKSRGGLPPRPKSRTAVAAFHDGERFSHTLGALADSGFAACDFGLLGRFGAFQQILPAQLVGLSGQVHPPALILDWPANGDDQSDSTVKSLWPLATLRGGEQVLASEGWPLMNELEDEKPPRIALDDYLRAFLQSGHAERLASNVSAGGLLLGVSLGGDGTAARACQALLAGSDYPVHVHDLPGRSST